MPTEREITDKFWKALQSDRTVMLGLPDVDEGHCQPMTAQFEERREGDDTQGGPIWFFGSKDTEFVRSLKPRHRAMLHFASKDHEVFASLDGEIVADNDRAVIDRLWNRYVEAWFKGGKDDPLLQLLRFEPARAQIWLNENSLFAGVKLLLGRDPKKDYADKTATVGLGGGGRPT
jgi:general stress protein 26